MTHPFCPGYAGTPYQTLVETYPGAETYPPADFRTEWGPIFHRGRLDGSARILLIGQDPATHEDVARRILVGEAGQRIQGFLDKLGITTSYVFVNTFLYSVYGQAGGSAHAHDTAIATYRNAWLDALVAHNQLDAVVTLGTLADTAYQSWQAAPGSPAATWRYVTILHPTYPDSASASGTITKAAAFARLCVSWNHALDLLTAAPGGLTADVPVPLVHYGTTITPAEHGVIGEADLPPGLPDWMRGAKGWAVRGTGTHPATTPEAKRANLLVTIPS
jgi:uracil-DNA glycosylase